MPSLVSVLMITYRHAPYLAQAIESVLAQRTQFAVQLVIGEDCSPDDTRAIAERYAAQYPDRILLLPSDHNRGALRNLVRTYHACQGEFVAYLEGDDYWIDPLKLQTQVDFLRQHPECCVCFTNAAVVQDDTTLIREQYFPEPIKPISDITDLLLADYAPTMTLLFRNGIVREFPEWYFTLKMGDWPLLLMLSYLSGTNGKLGFLPQTTAHYRVHGGGIWSGNDLAYKVRAHLPMYRGVDAFCQYQYHALIQKQIAFQHYWLASLAQAQADHQQALLELWRAWQSNPTFPGVGYGLWLRLVLRNLLPRVYARFSRQDR